MSKEKLYQRGIYLPHFPLEEYKHERKNAQFGTLFILQKVVFLTKGIEWIKSKHRNEI